MLLNGLAILAVVFNHASGWGYTAMVYWADRYRPVTVPNFDQVWSPSFYGLIDHWTTCRCLAFPHSYSSPVSSSPMRLALIRAA